MTTSLIPLVLGSLSLLYFIRDFGTREFRQPRFEERTLPHGNVLLGCSMNVTVPQLGGEFKTSASCFAQNYPRSQIQAFTSSASFGSLRMGVTVQTSNPFVIHPSRRRLIANFFERLLNTHPHHFPPIRFEHTSIEASRGFTVKST